MKKTYALLLGILVGATTVMAGPIAPLVPPSKALMERTGKTAEELNAPREKNIPEEKEIGVPAYPGSYFYQSNNGPNGELWSIVLISRDEPEKVRAWYKENYAGSRRVTIKPFTLYEWMLQFADLEGFKTSIDIDVD